MKSLLALLLAAAPVFAAPVSQGVLDEQEVFKKYAKALDMQAEIRKSEESAQASVGERVKVVEQLQTEMVAIQKRGQDPMLSENGKKAVDAELQQKNAVFVQRRGELQNFLNEARGAIQQPVGQMNKQIRAHDPRPVGEGGQGQGTPRRARQEPDFLRGRFPRHHRSRPEGIERRL